MKEREIAISYLPETLTWSTSSKCLELMEYMYQHQVQFNCVLIEMTLNTGTLSEKTVQSTVYYQRDL